MKQAKMKQAKCVLMTVVLAMFMSPSAWSQTDMVKMHDMKKMGKPPMGPNGHRRPPKEALAACEGKASGAACSFTGRENETVSGTCFQPSSEKPLACKPADHRRPGNETGERI